MCAYSLEKGSSFFQGILVVRETEINAHCPCFQVFITKFRDTLVCREALYLFIYLFTSDSQPPCRDTQVYRDTAVENHCDRFLL